MKAIIMAGGEGTRLRPLTCDTPKPLVPLLGRPIMRYAVELLNKHGIFDIAATVAYKAALIEAEFAGEVRCFREETPLGTAGSVKMCEEFLEGDDDFVILSGDALTDLDISAAANFHREKGSVATLVLKRVENPLEYGVVHCAKNGRIKKFVEKPDWGSVISDTVNTGIYILSKKVLDHIPEGKYDFGKELFPKLVAMGLPVFGYVMESYWCDIGDVTTYMSAQRDMLFGKVKISVQKSLLPEFIMKEGAVIDTPCYIGKGAVIGERAHVGEGCVIGGRVRIGAGARIENAVILSSAHIGIDSLISGCVVQGNAIVGENVSVHAGAVIGAGAHVGSDAVVYPGVRIWPLRKVEDGAMARANITGVCAGGFAEDASLMKGFISPENAALFAAAFVSGLDVERLCVSHGKSPAAAMLAMAAQAGAVSVGCRVFSCGESELAALLFSSLQKNSDGCLHIGCENGESVIYVMHNQAFLETGGIRTVRQMLLRGDFSRQPYELTKDVIRDSSAQECYDVWKRALLSGKRVPIYGDAHGMDATLYHEDGSEVDALAAADIFAVAAEYFAKKAHGLKSIFDADGDLRIGILSKYLAEKGLSQREIIMQCGGGHASIVIDCPNRLKGAAMRLLLERHEDRATVGRGITIRKMRALQGLSPVKRRSWSCLFRR